ncbi:fungal-specific transcription factor domain-containing protein [Aspergillus pseudodeflectus]|uniref:Fungal-specific transcription factor domain-containing protein n=1 Tax=Aspergillus pseudodeflectus TaxID=176178 RepID=A0ABR4KU66_9EURO
MPRPQVQESNRRRIAKACLHCQSAKLKCDGKSPCNTCARRQQPESCAYSDRVRSYGHRRQRAQKGAPGTNSNETDGIIEIAVPKLPQSLYDTRGNVVYLGDCSALSFLQNIQELIERAAQPSNTAIHTREFEELPPDPDDRSLSSTGSIEDLTDLIKTFFTVTSGLLDIIDPAATETLLYHWIHGTLSTHRGSEAVLYLILAYASQARASNTNSMEKRRAHSFYHHGRHIALLHLTDDPSLETVQAFILISLYMLAGSRRNGAFLNLGIAISAAKALGLHRVETNRSFPVGEARLRERIWATLRYHDLFFCAMMGRTSATITTDCTVSSTQPPSDPDPSVLATQETPMLYSAHAFSFMERTVNEIYTKRTVSMGVLKDLAQELREAIKSIPQVLAIPIPTAHAQGPVLMQEHPVLLRNANVLCSYHFAMMLLTRPFVVASLRARLGSQSAPSTAIGVPSDSQNDAVYDELATHALSCIHAAIETIRILHALLNAGALYSNMPLAVAWTFVSSLTICSAYFGQLGASDSNEHAIAQAREILEHFALSSPQARRYRGILGTLSDAAMRGRTRQPSDVERGENSAEMGDMSLLDSWNMSNFDMGQFPLDLGNAGSIWDLNWVGSLM